MSLPALAQWGRDNPQVTKVNPTTVNKQLGAVQAICRWAHDKGGFVPDEIAWADPFARQRLTTEEPGRESFTPEELKAIFGGAIFTTGARPEGGKGEAAFWLPLLGLLTGLRRSELAAITAENVDSTTHEVPVVTVTEDKKRGKRVKSRAALRTIPIRSELIQLGFLEFARETREARGADAWLFPQIAPDRGGALKAWSKWFGRYLDGRGIVNPDRVFHSFRHSFTDALRAGGTYGDLLYALAGHAAPKGSARVNEGYGAKQMVRRFSIDRIVEAITRAKFPGLDLSHVRDGCKRYAQAAE